MGVNTRETLEQVLQHVRDGDRKADLVLITGDLTHDETSKGYERLRDMLEPLQIPVYIIPGNHDVPVLMQQTMPGEWVSTQTQIVLDSWQIIMLDSSKANSESGHLAEKQLQLLSNCLGQYPNLHTLVCLHHQPVAIGSAWLDTMQLENDTQFFDIINQHAQVKAIIWGHVHQDFSQQTGHLQLFASPSTCKQFMPLSKEFAIDKSKEAGYRWLKLFEDGRIETEVIWLSG